MFVYLEVSIIYFNLIFNCADYWHVPNLWKLTPLLHYENIVEWWSSVSNSLPDRILLLHVLLL